MNHPGPPNVPHDVQPTDLADQPQDPSSPPEDKTPPEAEVSEPVTADTPETADTAGTEEERTPGLVRRIARSRWTSYSLTALACVLVYVALLWPNVLRRLTLGSFARIPIEFAAGILVMALLPRRPRVVLGTVLGAGLGWLLIQKSLDMGWFKTLARPFDIVLDWELFDDTYSYIRDSYGQAGAYAAAAGLVLGGLAVMALMAWAVRRMSDMLARNRRRSMFTAAGVATAWMLTLALGVQVVPTVPVAARTSVTYAYDRARQAGRGIVNKARFADEVKVDAYQNTPRRQLVSGLQGKDVILTFVESYGRNALEAPELAPGTAAVLADGDAKLKAAGFSAKSGWLTSPTFGGNSWLAHSTLLSGLWINNQYRYRSLTASDRLTLTSAFRDAEWDTVSVMPGATRAWPEGAFYGYNRIWDSRNLGYQGPKFSWAQMPDQYTLKKFTELEYGKKDRRPLMVEMPLISSHTPWAPIPTFMDWDKVGDGSIYRGMAAAGTKKADIWTSADKVRTEYGKSIRYTLTTLIDWVREYGDDDLVLVFLGDHQPASVVTGDNASHDVPITIVAKDPAVLDRIDSWNWADGLKPTATTPVWPMDSFRDRFFQAFGSTPGTP
ncbi:hypothetical protein GCM10025331_35750 [Actinoplanes utahensis]|nr:hypothetical protein Aut01nite_50570 [Actinoplanes utahensis]